MNKIKIQQKLKPLHALRMIYHTIFTLIFSFSILTWAQANSSLWLVREVTSLYSTWSAAMCHCFHPIFLSLNPCSPQKL